MNLFLGLLFVILGGLSIYYSNRMKEWFGRWSFAEKYFGGTQQGYVLVGFGLIVIGLLAIFGVVNLAK